MKRYKIINWHGALPFGLLLLILAFSSCSKEPLSGDQTLPEGAIRIILSVAGDSPEIGKAAKSLVSEDGSAEEDAIANIKVLFYDSDTKHLVLFKSSPSNDPTIKWKDNSLTITDVYNQSKAYDIYVIANWTDGFKATDFEVGSPIENLTAAFTTISGQILSPNATRHLLMSGSVKGHIFSKTANGSVSVGLVRQVAKLRLRVEMGKAFESMHPNASFGAQIGAETLSELTVYNIPNRSYVSDSATESSYNMLMQKPGSSLLDYPTIPIEDLGNIEVYVYENITLGTGVEAKQKATSMVLRLPYRLTETSAIETENYYKFYVQDNDNTTDPHQTMRNHIYDMTVTVVGFGKKVPDIGGITVTTNVLPWGHVPLTDSDGSYLTIDKLIGSTVPKEAVTSKFNIKTNMSWKAEITSANGATLNLIEGTGSQELSVIIPANLTLFDNVVKVKVSTTEVAKPYYEAIYTVTQSPSKLNVEVAGASFGISGNGTANIVVDAPFDYNTLSVTVKTKGAWKLTLPTNPSGMVSPSISSGDQGSLTVQVFKNTTDYVRVAVIHLTTVNPVQTTVINITQHGILHNWEIGAIMYKSAIMNNNEELQEIYSSHTNGQNNTWRKGKDQRYFATARCHYMNSRRLASGNPTRSEDVVWFLPSVEEARAIVQDFKGKGRPPHRGPFAGFVLDCPSIPGHYNWTSTGASATTAFTMNPSDNADPIVIIQSQDPMYIRCVRRANPNDSRDNYPINLPL